MLVQHINSPFPSAGVYHKPAVCEAVAWLNFSFDWLLAVVVPHILRFNIAVPGWCSKGHRTARHKKGAVEYTPVLCK